MAKELLIMRHAKSSWADSSLSDHDRPLNKRGLRDAPRMAQLLVEWQLVPDIILASSASRAQMTAHLVAEIFTSSDTICPERQTVDTFYLAAPSAYIETLQQLPAGYSRPMVVGHNPGLEYLVSELTGHDEFMSTAAIAHVHLNIEAWNQLQLPASHALADIYRPKEVL